MSSCPATARSAGEATSRRSAATSTTCSTPPRVRPCRSATATGASPTGGGATSPRSPLEEADERLVEAGHALRVVRRPEKHDPLRAQPLREHVADGIERGTVRARDDELREGRRGERLERRIGLR